MGAGVVIRVVIGVVMGVCVVIHVVLGTCMIRYHTYDHIHDYMCPFPHI